jgi:glycosyltransferase involved in cell wall biosynthesis
MTEEWLQTGEPLVLHVIPTPLARGAQREARALADRLDRPGVRAHRVLSLFRGPPEVRPDISLGFDGGDAPAAGFDLRLVPKLHTALARLDPAVVVAHGGDPLKYLVPAMTTRRRPLAYYAIGTYAGPPRHRQILLWRRLLARADVVAAEGDEVRTQCIELMGVPPGRVVMVPNGRDPAIFRPSDTAGSSPPVVTFVGALNDGKGPDRFVATVAELRKSGIDFRAQVVGDGPLREALTGPAKVAEVDLLGSRSDVAELLRQSDIMVFPSRPAGEGMPGVLIEAGLSGLPVVATDVPGVRTVLADGETGLIVATDDAVALVEATRRLLTDPALRATMGRAARERCLRHFTLESVSRRWLDLLSPLLPVPAPVEPAG